MKKSKNKAKNKPKNKPLKKPLVIKAKNSAGVTPLADRVLVKPLSLEEAGKTTSFGIIIPDTVSKEKPEQGIVVAVGPGKRNDKGETMPMSVKIGDKIMFSKYGFDEIKVNGTEYFMVAETSILAILD